MANKRLLMAVSASILSFLSVTGCNSSTQLISGHQTTLVSGNWAFTSAASQTTPRALTLNVGFANVSKETLTAIAHLSGASCVSSTAGITFSGSIDSNNQLVLTSKPFNGNTLTVKGQLAADGKSISGATWSFSGGNCAALGSGAVSAMAYAQINGTYTGTFVDADNNQLAVSATLTQTTQPDENGQFHLSGSATFPNNPCFTAPVVTDSLVTGSSLSTTYTEGAASITATGTFNSSASQLTVTKWQVTGGLCDGDSGTGLLAEPE
jgi:hypothetical protein